MVIIPAPPVLRRAGSVEWVPNWQMQDSPRALNGGVQSASLTGGGFWWSSTFNSISLRTHDDYAQWYGQIAISDGGMQLMVAESRKPKLVPWPIVGGRRITRIDQVPHSDGTFFSEGTGYSSSVVVARLAADAAAGATTMVIEMLRSGPIRGGHRLSINHPVQGWRMYMMGQVVEASDALLDGTGLASGTMTVTIRGPLREAAPTGTEVEFDNPRCVVRLKSFSSPDEGRRRETASATFEEWAVPV